MPDEETAPHEHTPGLPAMPSMPPPPGGNEMGFGSAHQGPPSGLSTGPPLRAGGPSESGVRRQGGILMMAGAATVLVSLPLALYSVTGPTGTSSFNELGQAALWPLVICVFAFLRGYSTIRPTTFRTSLPILSGVFITWAAYDRWSGINDLMKSATAFPGVTVSLGVGFWLLSLGAALIVVGSVILQFVKPQHH